MLPMKPFQRPSGFKAPEGPRPPKNHQSGDTSKSSGTFSDRFSVDKLWLFSPDAPFVPARLIWRLRLNKGILGCARRAKRRRRLSTAMLILGHVERQLTRKAEQSGVALLFRPHSKNAAAHHAKGITGPATEFPSSRQTRIHAADQSQPFQGEIFVHRLHLR